MRLQALSSRTKTSFPKTLSTFSVAGLLCGLLTGCGTATFIVQQYDGSPLAAEQVAILRLNGDAPVRLEALDGEPLGYELHDRASRVHIEMLPGEHELALAEGPELPAKRRRFRAEAGKVYRPLLVRTASDGPVIPGVTGWVIGIYEVNAGDDEIVREISQVAVTATPTAAQPATAVPVSTSTQTPPASEAVPAAIPSAPPTTSAAATAPLLAPTSAPASSAPSGTVAP